MKNHWGAILALCGHTVASAQQAPLATVTTWINTGTCGPNGASGGLGAATGTGYSGGSTSLIVLTTTNSEGSTIVTTSTSVASVAVPSYSNSVSVYTTTDSYGSPVVTSSTTMVPIPSSSTSVSVFTTTNSQGSTVITSSTTIIPISVPSSSTSVSVFTTTDSQGSIVTTSSTTVVPVPSSSTSVSVFTTTDSQGSIVTISSTTVVPVPSSSTSVSVFTTTNPQGSTITTSSTKVVPVSSPTTSATVIMITTTNGQGSVVTTSTTSTTTATPSLCPGGTGTKYTDANGKVYDISCGLSYPGSDLPAIHTDAFTACMLACSNYVPQQNAGGGAPCVAVSWGEGNPGGNCYLKYSIGEVNPTDGGIDSGRLDSYNPSTPPTTITTGAAGSSSTTSTSSALGNPGVSSISTTTTATSSINSAAAASPCPSADNSTTTSSSGNPYQIYCSAQFPGKDLPSVHEDTFEACLVACDVYVPSSSVAGGASCVAVSWGQGNVGGNCYLKYAITEIVFNDVGFCSGQMTNYNPPSVSSSTESTPSTSTTPPTSSSISATPTTSSSSSTTTSSTSTSSSSTLSTSTSTSSSSTLSTSTSTSSSSTLSTSTSTSSSSTLSTSTSTSSSSTISTSTSTSSSLTISTSTSTSRSSSMTSSSISSSIPTTLPSTTTSATVTSVSAAASPTNSGYTPTYTPVCPAANNTQYVDYAGSLYNIKCGLQINGKNLQSVHADTFNACIEYCDLVTGCAGTTYLQGAAATNTNCYPYSQFISYNTNSPQGVYSAVLANGGQTNETIDSQTLCPGLNGSEFKDPAGYTYLIGCDLELNGADLAPAVTPDLSGCLQFCDTYLTCVGVDFGPGANNVGNGYNCYPKSTYTNTTYVGGNQYAHLISGP